MMYSEKGNMVFMGTVGTAAVLAATAVAVLGLTNVSLAILIIATISSVLLGRWLETLVETREEERFQTQFEEDET